MMNIELDGVISGKGGRPTLTWQLKRRGDQMKKVPFMRFNLFCEDMTRRPAEVEETGKMRRPRKPIQIIIPEHKLKLFEHLEPGRRVLVKGRFTNDGNHKNGETYTNDKCYMADLTFLDSSRETQISRAVADMVSAGIFEEGDAESHTQKMKDFYAGMTPNREEPRIIIDETVESDSSSPNEPNF